jgi:hypothetical protein
VAAKHQRRCLKVAAKHQRRCLAHSRGQPKHSSQLPRREESAFVAGSAESMEHDGNMAAGHRTQLSGMASASAHACFSAICFSCVNEACTPLMAGHTADTRDKSFDSTKAMTVTLAPNPPPHPNQRRPPILLEALHLTHVMRARMPPIRPRQRLRPARPPPLL